MIYWKPWLRIYTIHEVTNLIIRRKARESVGLSGNESETSAEAQTLGERLIVSGILNP